MIATEQELREAVYEAYRNDRIGFIEITVGGALELLGELEKLRGKLAILAGKKKP